MWVFLFWLASLSCPKNSVAVRWSSSNKHQNKSATLSESISTSEIPLSKQSIQRQEFMHFQLHRDNQEKFSIKEIPNYFQKTEKFLWITQQLKENKVLGQIHFLMHISYPSETVILPALSGAPWVLRTMHLHGRSRKRFPILRSRAAPPSILQQHLKTVHLTATNITGSSLHWNSVRKPRNSREAGLLRATQCIMLSCYETKSLPMEL